MNTLRDLITKYRKRLLWPVSAILFMLVAVQLYFIFTITPQPNDECLWIPRYTPEGELALFFEEVKFEGVTWKGGIRDGDQLLEINGHKIENSLDANAILFNLEPGDTAIYRVNREGRTFDAEVEVKKLIQMGGLAYTIFGAIWLLVSIMVISAKPDGYTQILFFRIGTAFVLFTCFNILDSQNIFNPVFDYTFIAVAFDIMQSFGGIFIPFLMVHFFWIFPRKFSIIDRKFTTKVLYITPSIIFIIVTLFKIIYLYDNQYLLDIFIQWYARFVNGLISISLIIGLVSLFMNYLRIQTKNERTAIFIILISYVIVILTYAYTVIIYSSLSRAEFYNSPELLFPVVLTALLPIAFGFSIFRYSLMDVTDVVKNTILYGAATLSIASIYFLLIYVVGQSISSAIGTQYQGIIAGILFIIFALVFQSTKEKFQEVITRKFYPEQFAYQKMLHQFSNDVVTIVGLENIIKSTCNTLVEALQVDRFGIMLKNKSGTNSYRLAEGIGFYENPFMLNVNIVNLAQFILSKKDSGSLLIIDESDFKDIFPESSQKLVDEKIFTVLPLIIQSKIIGFMLFGLKHSGSKFAGKDLELLSIAANQTAIAIENARLYESESEKLKLDRDLENARLIQNSLLPSDFPSFEGFDVCGIMIPAMHVGGDYYDLIKVSEDKLFAVIGDVSGKGLSASFYMSKLQTMMQLYCDGSRSPKEILSEINSKIFGSIDRSWFITVSVALFDINQNTILLARAGHTPLVAIGSNETKEYSPKGIGIGLEKGELFNATIEEILIPIEDNTLYVLFSDGVTELMNSKNEFFGMDRLLYIFQKNINSKCFEILNTLIGDLEFHKKDVPQNDDITFLLMKKC
ncbi:MAG: SpoIIE family protein phosphatase [Melioribacteraceae bacterium]|nr:SpoIIE family protein phosphatase [Melioribacteraceae bacterium]